MSKSDQGCDIIHQEMINSQLKSARGGDGALNKELRQEEILRLISDKEYISMKDLEDHLNISMITLRRDIVDLAKKGFIVKTYGGIKKANNRLSEARFFERLSTNRKAKESMARAAMGLIENGDTVFFDTSTTVYELALWCCKYKNYLNVVTNGLLTATELLKNPTFNITIIGGTATSSNYATAGIYAEKMASEISVSKAFISCSAFHPDEGTFENVPTTGNIKKLVVRTSDQLILLVDQSKFYRKSIMKTFDVSELDYIISDRLDPDIQKRLRVPGHYICGK